MKKIFCLISYVFFFTLLSGPCYADWLSGWDKRIKITGDATKVDAALSDDLPVPVFLGTSVGQDAYDASCVFDELGSDANRKKIAVTTSNGTTECYVEIERWDHASETAILWVSLPSVSDSVDTDFYLYYDSTQSDNTTYVGDTGDAAAQSVWDDDFTHVFHHAADPSGGADSLVDSTGNANHGDPTNMASGDLVDAAIGKGYQYDTDEFIDNVGETNFSLDAGTVEFIMKQTSQGSNQGILNLYSTDSNLFIIWYWAAGSGHDHKIRVTNYNGGTSLAFPSSTLPGTTNFEHWTLTYDFTNNSFEWFLNGASDATDSTSCTASTATGMEIGRYTFSGNQYYLAAYLDEVRISTKVRSDAWIKASYYACIDDFLTFGAEEEGGNGGNGGSGSSTTGEYMKVFLSIM